MKKDVKPVLDGTSIWTQYQYGINYKQRIGLYDTVRESYRYLQGDQWGSTQSEGLPTPVFNIIKPVLNYKISQMFDKSTKINYQCNNRKDRDFVWLEEVTEKLTDYAEELWELLKMDQCMESMVFDSAITGNGVAHFFYDDDTEEVLMDILDITNVYPGNPNCSAIEDQPYIILAFRMTTEEAREDARRCRELKLNKLTDYEIDSISDDSENQYEAGERAQIEMEGLGQTTVLLKYRKKNGRVYMTKSTRNCEYIKDYDMGLKRYPIAKFDWEKVKNSFFGAGDVQAIIPNQDYINTIAAMIMASTTFTAFPKMVYNEDYVDNPSNQIGVAIGINGGNEKVQDVIDYIAPGNISSDAFQMFQQSMDITKDLMGANDSALGAVDPDKASGRAIIAVMEQSQVPLERTRRRYYDFIEDVALIWADMWRAYTDEDEFKTIIAKDENDVKANYNISKKALEKLLFRVRIDVGTTNRWSMISVEETLQNMLAQKYITFDMFLEALPDDSVIPKKKLLDMVEKERQRQLAAQTNTPNPEEEIDADAIAEEMAGQNNIDLDALIGVMSPEEQQEYLQNPEKLQELIRTQLESQ